MRSLIIMRSLKGGESRCYVAVAVAVACLAVGISFEAQAQDSSESDESSGGSADRLEEIIVTARKRDENIRDVPMGITALDSETIDRRGLVNSEDYLRGMVSVNQTWQINGQQINIRGIGTSDASPNQFTGATAGFYFGETSITSAAGTFGGTTIDGKLSDIERVEVLRGPQGTAFGSSSLSGLVRTIPKAPKLDGFEGKVAVGYSVTSGTGGDNNKIEAMLNVPLIVDKLAVRAVGYQFTDDGYYRNVAGDADHLATATILGGEEFAVSRDNIGKSTTTGGRIAANLQATDNLSLTVSYLNQETEVDGWAGATTGYFEQAMVQVGPPLVDPGRKNGSIDTDIELVNLVLEYDLGWADLLASYSDIDSGFLYVLSVGPDYWPWALDPISRHDEQSAEIRMATKLDGAWNFLAGLYAEEFEDISFVRNYWYGSPASNVFIPGNPTGFNGGAKLWRDQEQRAAFGEITWDFLEKFTLTAGLRAYKYDRRAASGGIDAQFQGELGAMDVTDDTGTNGHASLKYTISDDAMVYASWGQGFRLGRPLLGLRTQTCDVNGDGLVDGTQYPIEATKRTRSDYMDSYELGGKFSLLDRRLAIDVAVFHMDWTDFPAQLQAPPQPEGCGGPGQGIFSANVGEAVADGIEFQASYYSTSDLLIEFSASYIDHHLTTDNVILNAFTDDPLPGSPKLIASLGLQYGFNIGAREFSLRGDASYVGDFRVGFPATSDPVNGDYTMVGASVRTTIENVAIDLFVRNLTNEDAFQFGAASYDTPYVGFYLRPRTVGVQLGVTF